MGTNRKQWMIVGGIVLVLCGSIVMTIQSSEGLRRTIKENKIELKGAQKELDALTVTHGEVQTELLKVKSDFFERVAGFKPATIDEDDDLVMAYLDKMFTWTTGEQYDKQRLLLASIDAEGTDKLLKEIMVENYRVPMPDELKGKIEDNDIDIHNLKSKLVSTRFNRLSWDKSADADVTYTARITYQVYINEADLKADYQTKRDMLFTLKLSGQGLERKVVYVSYAFVQ